MESESQMLFWGLWSPIVLLGHFHSITNPHRRVVLQNIIMCIYFPEKEMEDLNKCIPDRIGVLPVTFFLDDLIHFPMANLIRINLLFRGRTRNW